MTIDLIRTRLHDRIPQRLGEPSPRAAVAIVLREENRETEFVVIHRSHRHGDPWSGHMALPGGRQQAGDPDLPTTAARETLEEIGVNLLRTGELLGALDDLPAVGRGQTLNLVITPFVYAVHDAVDLVPNPLEVQSAFWVPLASLRRREARGTIRHLVQGHDAEFPAFLYGGYTIWGLTHRILSNFLDLLDNQSTS
jgi:8-oxo-dGTP pyrophosphatase MutT (NUDIX family)